MEIPLEQQGLFQFWRFCYPILDAARESCAPRLVSLAEGTQLRSIGASDAAHCEQLRLALERQLETSLPEELLQPHLTMLELSERLGKQLDASDSEKKGFYEEFPHLKPAD